MTIRTRFAPSPTGYMHVGNLRTALFAYLFAKHNGGDFILRIEDTDKTRQVENGVEIILKSLYWAGIVPIEGVLLDKDGKVAQKGKFGPYIQSERLPLYQKYAQELLSNGHAYYCFCSAERLKQLREYQEKHKLPTGYDGECLKISPADAAKRVAAGEKYVIRLKMPKEGETVFNDLIRGEVKFQNILVDDQVLIKTDGFPTYHMAVVVDDHLMEITHIFRGDEWISSTPKHIQLYKCFGWEPPKFAHLTLLLNADKSKLSKRQGDVAVEDYRKKGYLPEAIVNFIAFLGWNPGGERELFSLNELIKEFSLEKVSKAGAVFNLEKLDWFNKEYLKSMPINDLAERAKPWLQSVISSHSATATAGPRIDAVEKSLSQLPTDRDLSLNTRDDKLWLAKVIELERERVTTLSELPEAVEFVFELPVYDGEILVWKKSNKETVIKILSEINIELKNINNNDWLKARLEKKVKAWIGDNGYNNGEVLWPLRVALSGKQNSPGPFEIAEVLGKEEVIKRINFAITKLK